MGGFAVTCFGCVLSVAVFFSCFIAKLEAQTLKITSNPTGSTYVKSGENITLDITYEYTGSEVVQVQWRKDLKVLIRKNSGGKIFRFENRAYLNGVNLVLTNPKQKDNGKYTVELKADDVTTTVPPVDFVVVIQVQPVAKIECHGKNKTSFYCECKTDVGNPPPLAYWSNGGKMIGSKGYWTKKLILANITKDHSQTYTCHVQSGDLTDQETLNFEKPKSVSFSSSATTVSENGEVTLTCKAESVLPVTYNITFPVGICSCVAANIFGKSAKFDISLKKGEKQTTPIFSTTMSPTATNSNNMSSVTEDSNCATKWHIIAIAVICGICFGMAFLYAIQFLCQRIKNKKGNSEPAPYEIPESQQKEIEDNSVYQELELENREPENSYQALRKTRRKVDNEIKIEDEAGYQELDKVRENNDNYQSLNRV